MIGKTVSHYKIIEKIGEGGMGVVYKAEDTNLKRTVALKFLPPHLTHDEATRKRFLVEARAESALDHPNICTIHEINETEDGQLYICMAYYAGESLKQKIRMGALPPDEAIQICIQIARGLSAAHKKNIIHRDIKPNNILITEDSEIKIVDFGLAKLTGEELTKTFSTKGTIAYLAPEIIRGLPGDQRSDIWSLGVTIYEMLSGQLPFSGDVAEAMMYAIVNNEPDPLSNLKNSNLNVLPAIISKLLNKDPADRYQDVEQLIADLDNVLESMQKIHTESSAISSKKKLRKKNVYIFISLISFIITLVIISLFLVNPFSSEPIPPVKTIPFTSLPGWEGEPAFSPDGTQIAFTWRGKNDDNTKIYVKLIGMGTQEQYRLTNKSGYEFMPAWSADGRYIAFGRIIENGRGIYMIPARGGIEKTLVYTDASWWYNLSWSPDGKTIAYSNRDSTSHFNRICLLSVDSQQIRGLTDGPELSLSDSYCAISPDGQRVAFVRGSRFSSGDIYIIPITGGQAKRLTYDNSFVWGLTWTVNGKEIVFSSDRGEGGTCLWRISTDGGNISQILAGGNNLEHPMVSKRGDLLAYEEGRSDINVFRLEIPNTNVKSIPSKLIYSTHRDDEPRYSPDGKKIAYRSFVSGSSQIWICNSDGDQKVQLTRLESIAEGGAPYWSPDGRTIAFDQSYDGQMDVFTIDVAGGSLVRLTKNLTEDHSPRFSHDGNWIYFNSNRSGVWQIWKIPAEGGEAIQVTENGGYVAYESYDGDKIYYNQFDSRNIWVKSLPDGKETMVLNYDIEWQGWDLVENGIYFILQSEEPGYIIYYYDFTDKKITEIARLEDKFIEDMCVSPDRKWILYSQEERVEYDIMLIENFR